jgi:hypothetical protein
MLRKNDLAPKNRYGFFIRYYLKFDKFSIYLQRFKLSYPIEALHFYHESKLTHL